MLDKRPLVLIAILVLLALAMNFFYDKNLIQFPKNIIPGKTQIKTETAFEPLTVKKTLRIPILMYHYVEYVTDDRDFIRKSLNITPYTFEAQIKTLKNAGYTIITPSDLPKIFEDPKLQDQKYAILSFDDGYKDFYTGAFPILKRQNVKAVNYIVYNFIGRLNYMTKSDIKELAESGLVEIGSHTLNHADLRTIPENIAYNEAYLSKSDLEKDFGIKVESTAYPWGFYNDKVKRLVKKAGYTTAVTSDEGILANKYSLYELKRIRAGALTGDDMLKYLDGIK